MEKTTFEGHGFDFDDLDDKANALQPLDPRPGCHYYCRGILQQLQFSEYHQLYRITAYVAHPSGRKGRRYTPSILKRLLWR